MLYQLSYCPRAGHAEYPSRVPAHPGRL